MWKKWLKISVFIITMCMITDLGISLRHEKEGTLFLKTCSIEVLASPGIDARSSGKACQRYRNHAFEGQTLLVYDWEGNLERSLLLDVPLVKVSYDREEQGIYGITSDGDLVKINCL